MLGNVSIKEIRLKNFKNVKNGTVKLNHITGVYGQNGSGKTAIIDAVKIIKTLLFGEQLSESTKRFITVSKKRAEVVIVFEIEYFKYLYEVTYTVVLSSEKEKPALQEEVLTYKHIPKNKRSEVSYRIFFIDDKNETVIKPDLRHYHLQDLYNKRIDIINEKVDCNKHSKSFMFSNRLGNLIKISEKNLPKDYEIILTLKQYAYNQLFILDNRHSPIKFNVYDKNVDINLEPYNVVLRSLFGGLELSLRKIDGCYELHSHKNRTYIPLRYESDGIKRIVEMLHVIMLLFKHKEISVFIDDIDVGVFEFLLGEIIKAIDGNCIGQLIFTAHNLRPLEVLGYENFVFTTANPSDRYIQWKNPELMTHLNQRGEYLSNLVWGKQGEQWYDGGKAAAFVSSLKKGAEGI